MNQDIEQIYDIKLRISFITKKHSIVAYWMEYFSDA